MDLAEVGDLVKHVDDYSVWLSRITHIDRNRFLSVKDEFILYNNSGHILSDTGIGDDDIHENYGKITLEEWFEIYPEYRI